MSNNTWLYSTASTTVTFINGYHIEQCYGFNHKESVPKVPIYGYNDYEFTKAVRGKGIVQGMMILNFVFPGYLTSVLAQRTDPYIPRLYNYDISSNFKLPSSSQASQVNIFQSLKTELPANSDDDSRRARAEFIANLLSRKNPKQKEDTKRALSKFFSSDPGNRLELAQNSVKKDFKTILSPLVADSDSSTGNQIDIYYQDPDLSTWFVRFNNVYFTEVSQNISQAGAEGSSEPLYEIYEFIAKNREIKQIKQ